MIRYKKKKDNTFEARSCKRKIKFPDRAMAEREAAKMDFDYKGDGRRMHAYKCNFCGGFHIGRKI
jgi:hypothetical protein